MEKPDDLRKLAEWYRGMAEVVYDLCIVDEASKATATEILVPMARSRKWILVGDPAQLPPFFENEAITRLDEFDEDVVPTGPLTSLPFQVLITDPPPSGPDALRDAAWLIRGYALSVLPSVPSLSALRKLSGGNTH